MARATRAGSIRAIANQKAQDYLWGAPESPEFSVVQALLHEFQNHESDEARWLGIYKRLAQECDEPLIRFLLNLIVADEERHHEIIGQIVAGLKEELVLTRSASDETAPRKTVRNGKELLQIAERLLRVERDGIGEYERLTKVTGRVHHELLALLCKTMVHDSLKHIGILEFLRTKLIEGKRRTRQRNA